jgi:dTDP-4-dehydrorhamnose 3,5-epimerase
VRGKVWDVMVDIRKDSQTFKRWIGLELSDMNCKMVFIPPGFAHGFIVLSAEAHLLYKCTEEYDPLLESGIRWNDPDINIQWPVSDVILSDKDKSLPFLKDLVDL